MAEWVDFLTFDVIGDLCFSEAFSTKDLGENNLNNIPHLTLKTISLGYKVNPFNLLQNSWLTKQSSQNRHSLA